MLTNPPRKCPVCASPNGRVIFEQRFAPISRGTLMLGYDVTICAACGMGYADRIPAQHVFDSYYATLSKYDPPDASGSISDFDRYRLGLVVDQIAEHGFPRDARILDVGCGPGHLLALLAERGYSQLTGMDPSAQCARVVRAAHGIDAHVGTLTDDHIDGSIGQFDLVVLLGVLEHIRDLHAALENLRTLVAPSGSLMIVVPDAPRYSCHNDAPFQEFSIEHINFFGPCSLAKAVVGYGFRDGPAIRGALEFSGAVRIWTPTLLTIFSSGAQIESTPTDFETEEGLVRYIAASTDLEALSVARLASIADRNVPVLVWGAGTYARRLLAINAFARLNIEAFVDANEHYHGAHLCGAPIISPDESRRHHCPIIIASRWRQAEIVAHIRQNLKMSNDLLTLHEL